VTGTDGTAPTAALEGVAAAVVTAIEELREQFPGHPLTLTPDGAGGVSVIIDGVKPGSPYVESTTWLGFQIVSAYPDADVYPHFTGRLQRVDGRPHGEGFSEAEWQGRPALQLSRRSNHWNRRTDTAALKAMKVMTWLGSR